MNLTNAAQKVFSHVVGLASCPKLEFNLPEDLPKIQFSTGTGVLLGSSGYVLTAKHVLPPAGWKLFVAINLPASIPQTILTDFTIATEYPEHDLAILRIAGPEVDLSFLNSIEQLQVSFDTPYYGTPLGSFGYPLPKIKIDSIKHHLGPDLELRFKSFYVAAINDKVGNTKYIVLDSFAYSGHSGGPVYDTEGKIIGLIVRSELDKSGQIPISYSHASLLSNIHSDLSRFLEVRTQA